MSMRAKRKKEEINFEINCTKAKWEPKTIADIPRVVGRSFKTDLTLKDISPFVGTDHIKEWPLEKDSDISVFMKEKSMLNEAFAEKVIRFTLPRNLMPKKWEPKKVKILARGDRLAKYFGEDQCSERQVQVSLKLFECGHFYLKTTLPGSGISPYWTIFEGAWEHTERGLKLEILIRYSWQVARKPEFDLNIECVPEGWTTSLAWSGESESQLNGNIPAVVGTEKWCWVEIYRDADKQEKVAARFNDEIDDDASWRDNSWKDDPKTLKAKKGASSSATSSDPPTALPSQGASSAASSCQQPPSASPSSAPTSFKPAQSAPSSSYPSSSAHASSMSAPPLTEDEESPVPLYIGLAFFVLILIYFAWQKINEVAASWAATEGEL